MVVILEWADSVCPYCSLNVAPVVTGLRVFEFFSIALGKMLLH